MANDEKFGKWFNYAENKESERRGSNPRHPAWEADTLPTELRSQKNIFKNDLLPSPKANQPVAESELSLSRCKSELAILLILKLTLNSS